MNRDLRYTPKKRLVRQDHYRWMREGTPNFDDRVFEYIDELRVIAKKDVKWITPLTPVMKAIEEMAYSYRSLPVISAGRFTGLLTAMRIINYLGGGELFQIIEKKHGFNIYSALNREIVESIMEKNPVVVYVDEGIREALGRMVTTGAGILPVLERDERVFGIITEHDFVKYLVGVVSIGLKARDVMSTPVVTINEQASFREAMETMVKYGFRRLPVVNVDMEVQGLITAMDILRAFGTHEVFEKTPGEDIRIVLQTPISEYMVRDVAVIKADEDLVKAVETMFSRNISSVLVVDDEGVLEGIITERDILYSIISPK